MRDLGRLIGIALIVAGLTLLAWLLYDATSVLEAFGLGAVVDEATVALLGLLVGAACVVLGIACWRRPRSSTVNAL